MFTISCAPNTKHRRSLQRRYQRAVSICMIGSAVLFGISGCGQKGNLYLAESSSQATQQNAALLKSTSHPQDAAFAGIDDDPQAMQDFELPTPSDDPNDY